MSTKLLRCYAVRRTEGYWESFCIDLCLAARGATLEQAKAHLEAQVVDYMDAALAEPEYAASLLARKAPIKQRATYQWLKILHKLNELFRNRDGGGTSFHFPYMRAA